MYLCFQRDWDSRKKLVCHVLPLKYSKSVCERERERTATSLRENLISRGYVQFMNEAEKRECLTSASAPWHPCDNSHAYLRISSTKNN